MGGEVRVSGEESGEGGKGWQVLVESHIIDHKEKSIKLEVEVVKIVFQFQHFGCFGPVVKHQECNLKASKATSNQI